MRDFRFGMSVFKAESASQWREIAHRAEDTGYDVLHVPDHLDQVVSPLPALAAAASVTERLKVGTLVLNNDLRHPAVLAHEAAALVMLSDGRFELGLGAGHARDEYERAGIPFDNADGRVARLRESLAIVGPMLDGREVQFAGRFYEVRGARVYPQPARPPPILVGGWGRGVLACAAETADIIGLTGLGRPVGVGMNAPIGFSRAAVDERVTYLRGMLGERDVELHALVQAVVLTDDPPVAAEAVAQRFPPLSADDVLECPFVLIGSVDGIADELVAHRERWGISYFTVFEPFAATFAPVVAKLVR